MWKDSWFQVWPGGDKDPEGFGKWWFTSEKDLDKLNLCRDCWKTAYAKGQADGRNEAKQSQTESVRPEGVWISVKDWLPEDMEEVLVYSQWEDRIDGELALYIVAEHFNGQFTNPSDGFGFDGEVTHWMPLPKPPEEE